MPSAGCVCAPKVTVPPGCTGARRASPSAVEKLMPSSPSSVVSVLRRFAVGTAKGSVMNRLRNAESSASAARYCSSRRSTRSCCSAVVNPWRRATFSAVSSIECGPSGSQVKFSITQSSCAPVPPGPRGFG